MYHCTFVAFLKNSFLVDVSPPKTSDGFVSYELIGLNIPVLKMITYSFRIDETFQKLKKTKTVWTTEETRAEVEKRRLRKGSSETTDQYKRQNSILQRLMRRDNNQLISKVCQKIEENSNKEILVNY